MTWHDMTWQSFIQYCNLQYVFSAIISFILLLYNSIKTASLETVFIPYHLICLYNNKFYKFVNYFKIVITTFTKLSLRAFPMRSNRILITMWLQPIVCSFHLALFFGLLTQGACQRHAERLPLVVRKSTFSYLDYFGSSLVMTSL